MQIDARVEKCLDVVRRNKRTVFFLCLIMIGFSFSRPVQCQDARPSNVESSGGTVNIILARGTDLVAVTDSMLTSGAGQHQENGVKLFKIDDRTLCTVAGFYFRGGAKNVTGLDALMPEIMSHVQAKGAFSPLTTFLDKARVVFEIFQFSLTSHLQASVTANEVTANEFESLQPSEITMAGYDIDGSLKVAEITLAPQKTIHGVAYVPVDRPRGAYEPLPLCELTAAPHRFSLRGSEGGQFLVSTIGSSFFCMIAGLPEVAEKILGEPYFYAQSGPTRAYARARQEGHDLSLEEMRYLAIDLERQTAEVERQNNKLRVGGVPQVALLSEGKVIEVSLRNATYAPGTGTELGASQFSSFSMDCTDHPQSIPFFAGSPGTHFQVQIDMTNCTQVIDGIVFHDSRFIKSRLLYQGGDLAFDANNVVDDSTLDFTMGVDTKRKDVHQLVCGFPWKAVYQDSKPLKLQCKPTPAGGH